MTSNVMDKPEPVRRAETLGHTPEWDGWTYGLSNVGRWTCTKCGRAVLDSGSAVYGSAIEQECGS